MSTPLVHSPVVLRDEYCVEQTIFKNFCYLLFVTMNGLLLAPIYARGGQSSAYLDQVIVQVYHVHIVCGYGTLTSSNESKTITNRDKKNTDCEKRMVIVNLSHCYS